MSLGLESAQFILVSLNGIQSRLMLSNDLSSLCIPAAGHNNNKVDFSFHPFAMSLLTSSSILFPFSLLPSVCVCVCAEGNVY